MRYITVDLCALDDGLDRYGLTADDHAVVSHSIMSDIVGDRQAKHAAMMSRWFKAKGSHIWIAEEWVAIAEQESKTKEPVGEHEWLDEEGTRRFRSAIEGMPNWGPRLDEFRTSEMRHQFEEGRNAFIRLCSDWAEHIEQDQPHVFHDLKSHNWKVKAIEHLRTPFLGGAVPRQFDERYRDPQWLTRLEQFPDRFAWGRMSRLVLWYAQAMVAGQSNNFGNNYEDAAHAFTASYSGIIATSDSRLKDAINAAFPHVLVLPRLR